MSEAVATGPVLNEMQKHRNTYPFGDPKGPMRSLPAIPKTMTPSEAEQKRLNFEFPDMIPGEPVFYRRKADGGNSEDIGWFQKAYGRTATISIARPGYTIEEKTSVGYWDHTESNPVLSGDPKAPFNNNGTFRRTEFGKRMAAVIKTGALMDIDKLKRELTDEVLAAVQAELDKMSKASVTDGRGKGNK